jgi:hypothetical protein
VSFVFSSHTLEHLHEPAHLLLQEIPRVVGDGARFEIWVPRTFHNNAHVFGHTLFWNEEPFLHLTRKERDVWSQHTGVTWNLERLVFVVDPPAMADVMDMGYTPGRAVRYLINVVHEFGVIGHFVKPGRAGLPMPDLEVSWSVSRAPADYHPVESPVWW